MDKYAQKDKKNMCNNCKETNQPENPTAINAAVELKEASDAVKRIHSAISDKGLTYYIETYGCHMTPKTLRVCLFGAATQKLIAKKRLILYFSIHAAFGSMPNFELSAMSVL